MGMTVLCCAFGVVALWLLGEVLLQHKARLRWRLLAFAGFLGVVVGVVLRSAPLIGAGTAAFAVGQTYVTLSFRRGFATGWSLRGPGGAGRASGGGKGRRRGGAPASEPTLRVPDLQAEQAEPQTPPAPAEPPVPPTYQPEPLPDDTDGYGIYRTDSADTRFAAAPSGPPPSGDTVAAAGPGEPGGYEAYAAYDGHGAGDGQHGYPAGGYDGYGADPVRRLPRAALRHPAAPSEVALTGFAAGDFAPHDYAPGGYDPHDYAPGGYDPHDFAPGGYDPATGYSDPAGFPGQAAGGYGTGYDPGGLGGDEYDQAGYPATGYGVPQQFSPQAPSEGAWVPQQPDGETPPIAPLPGESDPYHPGHHDPDGQYRY